MGKQQSEQRNKDCKKKKEPSRYYRTEKMNS